METSMIGPLRVHAAGGADRRGGGDGPTILLCHGFGAPGTDLVNLQRVVDAGRGVRWFFPEAPLSMAVAPGVIGRAWWHFDISRLEQMLLGGQRPDMRNETPEGLAEARAALEACIEALATEHGVRRDQLILGGFSQGGMLSTEVALHADEPFAGLVVFSGTLLCEDRWREAAARTGPTIDALMTHGRADPLLPFEAAEALRALLEEAGAQVEWVPHNGQHEIPQSALDRLGAFARRRLPQ